MIPIHPYLLFAAEKATDPVLEKLDPPRRAAVIMALLGLTLVGLFLIVSRDVGRTLGAAIGPATAGADSN